MYSFTYHSWGAAAKKGMGASPQNCRGLMNTVFTCVTVGGEKLLKIQIRSNGQWNSMCYKQITLHYLSCLFFLFVDQRLNMHSNDTIMIIKQLVGILLNDVVKCRMSNILTSGSTFDAFHQLNVSWLDGVYSSFIVHAFKEMCHRFIVSPFLHHCCLLILLPPTISHRLLFFTFVIYGYYTELRHWVFPLQFLSLRGLKMRNPNSYMMW